MLFERPKSALPVTVSGRIHRLVLFMNRIFQIFQATPRTRLGPLEQELLQILWERKSATVRELIDDGSIPLAYTTVMTTLDRLYKKDLLNRVPEGRAFRYSLRQSLQE